MAKLTNVATVDMVNGEITKVAYDGAEYAKVDATRETAKVGDLFLATGERKDITVGAFYEVIYDKHDRNAYSAVNILDDVNDTHDSALQYGNFFRKISDVSPTIEERVTALESDVAALKSGEVSVEPKRLTVGDVAKIIAEDDMHFGNIGDIVKIEVDAKDHQPYKCIRISDGKNVGWFFESELEAYNEETIEFEGATYRKVDREAREGDVVILKDTGGDLFKVGKKYKVVKGVQIADDDGDLFDLYRSKLRRTRETVDVYEPIEQAQYVPQEGDIVVVTANTSSSRNKVGDIGKIGILTSIDATVDVPQRPLVDGANGNWTKLHEFRKATPAEVEAYEQAVLANEKTAHKASFAVGDYVKVVKSHVGNEGAILRITGVGKYRTRRGECDFELESLTGKVVGADIGATADQLVKATDAEVAEALKPKLKAGDFVKITDGTRSIKDGETYEVKMRDSGLYIVDSDGDKRPFPLVFGAVKYEIVDAETAKWAKIGRKVNEYRKGDVVRVVEPISSQFAVGTIGTVVKDEIDSSHRPTTLAVTTDGRLTTFHPRVELVAPVESLFTTQN